MNTNIVIGGIIVVLVILVGVSFGMSADPTNQVRSETDSQLDTMSESESMAEDMSGQGSSDPMMDDMMSDVAMDTAEVTATSAGSFETYTADKVAMAEGDVVLFFAASWCPSCRALESDIRANRGQIPSGVTILKVDYDTATELKQQYGVTTQHTLVQVDTDGTQVKKWLGGNTLDSVTEQII